MKNRKSEKAFFAMINNRNKVTEQDIRSRWNKADGMSRIDILDYSKYGKYDYPDLGQFTSKAYDDYQNIFNKE